MSQSPGRLTHYTTHHSLLITMSIKESSEELNPPVVVAEPAVISPRPARTAKDYLALAIATCGVGYLPLAPGTWGSLLGVGLYLLLHSLIPAFMRAFARPNSVMFLSPWSLFLASELILITLITIVGIWAASRAEKLLGR